MPYKDKEIAREYRRQWRKNNKDKVKQYGINYRNRYRDDVNRKSREKHAKNPEKRRGYQRTYRLKPEYQIKRKLYKQEYNQRPEVRERHRAEARRYREKYPLRVKEVTKKYYENHKQEFIIRNHQRRELLRQGKFTLLEWKILKEQYENKCLSCGEDNIELTIDHIIPVSKNGDNNRKNIQPLCTKCNSTKRTKTIDFRPKPFLQRNTIFYVSGKYTDNSKRAITLNISKARYYGMAIWELGGTAIIPHLNTMHFEKDCKCEYDDYLAGDLVILRICDCLFQIDGWQSSNGAMREYEEAKRLGLKIFQSIGEIKTYYS